MDVDGAGGLVAAAVAQQQLGQVRVTGLARFVPGRPGLCVGGGTGVGQAAMAEHELGEVPAPRGRRGVQRRPSARALGIGVRARSEKKPRDLEMPAAGGLVQRRVAGVVQEGRLGPMGQQGRRRFGMAAGRRQVQGRGAAIVACVGAGAGLQQQADDLAVAGRGGLVQRRRLRLPPLADAKGVGGQYGPHRVHVAGPGGLIQVGRRHGLLARVPRSRRRRNVASP